VSVIDPQTWADAEDGRALRELRAALPEGTRIEIVSHAPGEFFVWTLTEAARGRTLAEAADALREEAP
jgi:hypothetical protein